MPNAFLTECCHVKNVCGRNLSYGVACVAVSTLVLSSISLSLAVLSVLLITRSEMQMNGRPLLSIDLVFGLMIAFFSVYQIITSGLLLWQSLKTKGNIFLCSVWYVSHISLSAIYGFMFCARAIISIVEKEYFHFALTVVVAAVYEGIFIYFIIVVNSYIHSIDCERYF